MDFVNYWKKLKSQMKYACFGIFFFGLIAHGSVLFNKYSVHDDLLYMFTGGATLTSGRWMLYIVEKMKNIIFQDNIYSLPAINGFFTFFCIAISLCILIDLFEIKSSNFALLLGGLMVSTPVVTTMFGYMFVAQFFGLAILFAVLGSFFILKKEKWYYFFVGILLLTFSIGIYQAYISLFLTIFNYGLFQLFSKADTREKRISATKKTLLVVGSCVVSLLLYLGIMNLCLRLNHLELSDYKGMNSFGNTSVSVYLERVITAYREFFLPEKGTPYHIFPGAASVIYTCLLLLFLCLIISQILRKFRTDKISGIFLIILAVFMPLCVNFSFVIVDISACYSMMIYSQLLIFVFGIWLFEESTDVSKLTPERFITTILSISFALMIFIFCRFDNVCYTRMEIVQTQTHRYFSSLITRMQSTPGYDEYMRVAYIGVPEVVPWNPTISEKDEFDYLNIYPYYGYSIALSDNWKENMQFWFDFAPREADSSIFCNLPEVNEMNHYPNSDSIRIINDTLIVKF